MRVAAIQLQSIIGDIDANLAACELLAGIAAKEGAEWSRVTHGYLQTSIERYSDWAGPFAKLVGCPVVEARH